MEEAKTYIVGIGGSDMDTVDTYRVVGTEEQIKKYLAKVCTDIGDGESGAIGTFKPEDIIYNGELYSLKIAEGCFAGYVNFDDGHVDITARPEGIPIYLGDDGDDEIPIEEVIRNFNERAIYVIFGDGSDALLQDNGYTIEDAKKFAKEGCTFYYDGPAPDASPAALVKNMRFIKFKKENGITFAELKCSDIWKSEQSVCTKPNDEATHSFKDKDGNVIKETDISDNTKLKGYFFKESGKDWNEKVMHYMATKYETIYVLA